MAWHGIASHGVTTCMRSPRAMQSLQGPWSCRIPLSPEALLSPQAMGPYRRGSPHAVRPSEVRESPQAMGPCQVMESMRSPGAMRVTGGLEHGGEWAASHRQVKLG